MNLINSYDSVIFGFILVPIQQNLNWKRLCIFVVVGAFVFPKDTISVEMVGKKPWQQQ